MKNALRLAAAALAAVVGLQCGGGPSFDTSAIKRPHLLVLVTDDQRWDAMRCMGNRIIETPNMDCLASSGVLFTNNFCTTSICATSRATIFTGQYARRHGITGFRTPLSKEQFAESYPGLLRKAGYWTGFIGKWGLGGPLPTEDFDVWGGFPGQGKYFETPNGEHLTSRLAAQAVDFIRRCPVDRPFCLSISFKAPHVQDGDPKQFLFDPHLRDLYRTTEIPPARLGDPAHYAALPDYVRESEGRRRWEIRFSNPEQYQTSVKGYYRLVTGVDRAVGRIIEALKERNLYDDTLILFTSDNGFFLGERGLAGKWLAYEESIRTPLIITHPKLPPGLRGRRVDNMALNIDVAPTLLDFAGVAIPEGIQGRSVKPIVFGGDPSWRGDWLYEHLFEHKIIPKTEGVRTDRWKYVRYIESKPLREELYDLESDPGEERNLAGDDAHRPQLRRMRARCDALVREAQ